MLEDIVYALDDGGCLRVLPSPVFLADDSGDEGMVSDGEVARAAEALGLACNEEEEEERFQKWRASAAADFDDVTAEGSSCNDSLSSNRVF